MNNIPLTVRNYLRKSKGQFEYCSVDPGLSVVETATAAGIPLARMAQVTILKSGETYLMAVFPADKKLDLPVFSKIFGQDFIVCPAQEVDDLFPNCDSGFVPPVAEPYGLELIKDQSLKTLDDVYFSSGKAGTFIHATGESFSLLHEGRGRVERITLQEPVAKPLASAAKETKPVPPEASPKAVERGIPATDRPEVAKQATSENAAVSAQTKVTVQTAAAKAGAVTQPKVAVQGGPATAAAPAVRASAAAPAVRASADVSAAPSKTAAPTATAGAAPVAAGSSARPAAPSDRLPPLPRIARELIGLRDNPYVTAADVVAVIGQDRLLAAQLIRYARMPLHGQHDNARSVEQIVKQGMGVDSALDVTIALALGRAFRESTDADAVYPVWRHAMHCASLAHALCQCVEFSRRPSASLAYAAGILHNFGLLVLAQARPADYARLIKLLTEYPDGHSLTLERKIAGVDHTALGVRLMEAWRMPGDVMEVVREHHKPDYHNEFSPYPNVIYIANALLRRRGIGDSGTSTIAPRMLSHVGLDQARAEKALADTMRYSGVLDILAKGMTA